MPYITQEARDRLKNTKTPTTAGELNYILTMEILYYFKGYGKNYQAINDVIGALEGAKAEFQRRIVAPYEDTKIEDNGDLYD
jgi:hypothetical protein